jgi:fatty acid-binding protein DegV
MFEVILRVNGPPGSDNP